MTCDLDSHFTGLRGGPTRDSVNTLVQRLRVTLTLGPRRKGVGGMRPEDQKLLCVGICRLNDQATVSQSSTLFSPRSESNVSSQWLITDTAALQWVSPAHQLQSG